MDSRVAQRIRELIVQGELPPGTRVAEAALAERLGVSRTPVRNALPALAGEGLLESAGKRGYSVRGFTIDAAWAAFEEETRGTIEAGKWADFTIVDGNFASAPASTLWKSKVRYTIVNGEIVYKASE